MRIALIGYGKMGHEIEKIAVERGHQIVAIVDKDNYDDIRNEAFRSAEAAIEFTTPETAFNNVTTCFSFNIPVVCGTTGWLDRFDEAKKICKKNNGTFFYASNYSLGVNIFFHINRELAKVMERFSDYDVNMEEIHHIHKKDAPSGTAITLAEDIMDTVTRKTKWINTENDSLASENEIVIKSIREGEVPGTHVVNYSSEVDNITIRHEAKSRKGFALGAVIAAEFIAGKKGIYTMKDILGV